MESRTVSYLRTRFGDYYDRADPSVPDAAHREFGVIPWTEEPDPPMFRHKSALDYGGQAADLLSEERPRHAYFSAARYEAPTTEPMDEKGWRGADLIFDLDDDHIEDVDESDPYRDRLRRCKEELERLLDLLNDDFGFEDMTVVFSGGRGYHVHVRDERIRELDRRSRRDIAKQVTGDDISFPDVTMPRRKGASESGRQQLVLKHHGGWGGRVHRRLVDLLDEVVKMDEDEALDRLQEYDNIGQKKAESIYSKMTSDAEAIRRGDVVLGKSFKEFTRRLIPETVDEAAAAIDAPVTFDTHRLIRIPRSLHGGTALRVTPLDIDEIEDFEPLVDAVPDLFRGGEIRVQVTSDAEVWLDGNHYEYESGTVERVPEQVGLHLMASGRAEKP